LFLTKETAEDVALQITGLNGGRFVDEKNINTWFSNRRKRQRALTGETAESMAAAAGRGVDAKEGAVQTAPRESDEGGMGSDKKGGRQKLRARYLMQQDEQKHENGEQTQPSLQTHVLSQQQQGISDGEEHVLSEKESVTLLRKCEQLGSGEEDSGGQEGGGGEEDVSKRPRLVNPAANAIGKLCSRKNVLKLPATQNGVKLLGTTGVGEGSNGGGGVGGIQNGQIDMGNGVDAKIKEAADDGTEEEEEEETTDSNEFEHKCWECRYGKFKVCVCVSVCV